MCMCICRSEVLCENFLQKYITMDRAARFNAAGGAILLVIAVLAIGAAAQTPPSLAYATNNPTTTRNFYNMYSILSANSTVDVNTDGSLAEMKLDTQSAGIGSLSDYSYGYISVQLKLCKGDTAGTVTAFYVSSRNMSDHHDEFDFEFLGNVSGQYYIIQTNIFVYGVGNREMRYTLWFDPTVDFHIYSIFWNSYMVAFYVDNAPIRVFTNNEAEGIKFPDKPVAIFGSLWDGSQWATQGGKYKLDLKYAPFVVEMRNLGDVDACVVDPATGSVAQCQDPANPAWWNQPEYHSLTPETLSMLTFIRTTFGTYDYCTDTARFPDGLPPECALRGW